MEKDMVCISTEEYKKLILDNDRLQRELDLSIVAEIESGRKVNELKEALFKLLDNAIDDECCIYDNIQYYHINRDKLSKYLTENHIDDIKKILEVRKDKKEESEDKVDE